MKVSHTLFIFAFAVLTGCQTFRKTGKDPAQSDVSLTGRYILLSLNGEKVKVGHSVNPVPYLDLDLSGKAVSGFAGCNRFSGSLETASDSLSVGILAATKMACPEGDLEAAILTALNSGKFLWQQRRNRLILKNNTHFLVFRKAG